MERMDEIRAFVASLTYDSDKEPMTVEDAAYAIEQWKLEGSIEPPEGFTPELYASIWNEFLRKEEEG